MVGWASNISRKWEERVNSDEGYGRREATGWVGHQI